MTSQAGHIGGNFFLAGNYMHKDYLNSMEGTTRSGLMVNFEVIAKTDGLGGLKRKRPNDRSLI